MPKLTIIGPGRLGKTLSMLLNVPHNLIGKHEKIPLSDLYYLTVPDREISKVHHSLPKGKVVLHASGCFDHLVLRPHMHSGVLHPLMTFPGPDINIPSGSIPARISGDPEACTQAFWLAKELGFEAFYYSGNSVQYHCAAVLAGNCGAILLHLAAKIMAKDTDMTVDEAQKKLAPLIFSSLQNTLEVGIRKSSTGPISRGDLQTIAQHRQELLSFDEHILRTYNALIESAFHIIKKETIE